MRRNGCKVLCWDEGEFLVKVFMVTYQIVKFQVPLIFILQIKDSS